MATSNGHLSYGLATLLLMFNLAVIAFAAVRARRIARPKADDARDDNP